MEGFGKTQIKIIIQKLKERKWRRTKEREGEKEERRRRKRRRRNSSRGWSVHHHYPIRLPTAIRPHLHHQTGSNRLVLLFLFFLFFSYLLVLIQLYCKNWILFCVLCLDYVRRFLRVKKRDWNKDHFWVRSDVFWS